MIATPRIDVRSIMLSARNHAPGVVMLAVALFVAALIARSYFGSSSSPYGMCYAESGRAVPCEAVKR